jgi:hypothetical protein
MRILIMCTDDPHCAQSTSVSTKWTRQTHLHVFTLLVVLHYSPNCATRLEHFTLRNTPTLPTLVRTVIW